MQLKFDTISPYNICADRLGITKTCNHWVATMAELKASGDFIVESTREYLPEDPLKKYYGMQRNNLRLWIKRPNK